MLAAMMDESDEIHAAGLDILRTRLRNDGIDPRTFHHPPMLTYPLLDGTTFVLTGHGRNNYAVTRYADDDSEKLGQTRDHLTLDQTLKIVTFR